MPIAKKYSISEILSACDNYFEKKYMADQLKKQNKLQEISADAIFVGARRRDIHKARYKKMEGRTSRYEQDHEGYGSKKSTLWLIKCGR